MKVGGNNGGGVAIVEQLADSLQYRLMTGKWYLDTYSIIHFSPAMLQE